MKELVKKYEIGDWCLIPESPLYDKPTEPFKIEDTFYDFDYICEHESYWRYRLRGLWFNEDEIVKVTKENDPELFL